MASRVFSDLAILALACSIAGAQQPSPRPAYDGSNAPDVAREIHVDGSCRIIPDPLHPLPGQKLKPFRDPNICYLDGRNDSEHSEERIQGNQLLRSFVRVNEETFVLQNITQDHVMFVVERPVPKGWTVDSDPQPNRYDGDNAVFPVHAAAGEIVRLHVGIRRTTALKPRTISPP